MVTRLWAETAVALFTLAYGLVIVRGATEFGIGWDSSGPEPGAFPFYAGLLVALASLGTLVVTWSRRLRADHRIAAVILDGEGLRRVISFFLPILGFVLICAALGMYVATIAYLFFAMRVQGGFGWLASLATAFGAALTFYVVIERIFLIQLMKGPLEALLGL